MRIALLGASGNVGQRLISEALLRGHTVTAISRNPSAVAEHYGVPYVAADVTDADALAAALAGHDIVISAVTFLETVPETLVDAVRTSGVPRYIAVGGAGSLLSASGRLWVLEADFPQIVLDESHAGRALLDTLRAETELDWSVLTPAQEFVPGERTGRYRLGRDEVFFDSSGRSWISYEDYAVALMDEVDKPRHSRQRFAVAY